MVCDLIITTNNAICYIHLNKSHFKFLVISQSQYSGALKENKFLLYNRHLNGMRSLPHRVLFIVIICRYCINTHL